MSPRPSRRNPSLRYRSAAEILVDLRRARRSASHETATAVAPPEPGFARRRLRRRVMAGLAAVLAMAGGLGLWRALSPAPEGLTAVAILPFADLDRDAETEFLGDALAGQIIDNLSQLPGVSVKSWHSVSRYERGKVDLGQVRRELDVDAVLKGDIRKRQDRVAIRVELIDLRNESHLWGEQYTRSLSDLFGIEEGISSQVAQQLSLRITGEHRRQLESYWLYKRARYHAEKRSEDGLTKAITYYQQLIEADPRHARAHAGLASCYVLLSYYAGRSPRETHPRALEAAARALELDDGLVEAHTALALIRRDYEHDWADAEREFERAIELDPNYATARQWYAEYLTSSGQFDEALVQIGRAQELEPMSMIIRSVWGWILLCAGRTDAAVQQLEGTVEMGPDFVAARWFLGQAYARKGQLGRAAVQLEEAARLSSRSPRILADLGHVYALAGQREKAVEILRSFDQAGAKRQFVSPYARAVLHAGLGNRDQAFTALDEALEGGLWEVVTLKVDPMLVSLHEDPRFRRLVRRVGLASD